MKLHEALTQGLQKGYGDDADFSDVAEDGLAFKTVEKQFPGITYKDRYADLRPTFGQEIVSDGDQTMFRVYVGKSVPAQRLEELGLHENDIIRFLKQIILEHGDKIRMYDPYKFVEGEWEYSYTIIDRDDVIGLVTGKEIIKFKDNTVFGHNFFVPIIEG
jgi:hypothetical protein